MPSSWSLRSIVVRLACLAVLTVLPGVESAEATGAAAGASDDADAGPEKVTETFSGPRELLALFDMDEAFFAAFQDRRPLSSDERERLLLILDRLRQIPPLTMERFSRSALAITSIAQRAAEDRGEVYWLRGTVTRVVREELPPEWRTKLGFETWYRCQLHSFAVPITLYVLTVPSEWKLDAPIDEDCAARAMFVKILLSADDGDDPQAGEAVTNDDRAFSPAARQPQLLFVANRVAWFPDNPLGRLDMDFTLFEAVRDKTRLDERECFYQMLATVRRAQDGEIEQLGRQLLAERTDLLRRMAGNRDLDAQSRDEAQRSLHRAEQGASDVVPLFNDPAAQRGKLFVLQGEALRAIEIRVDDADVAERFGIDRYYEVEIVTPDSQNNPIVCCLATLPPGMPLGETIRENVRVSGFFLKSWAFDTHASLAAPGEQKRQQLAPLLVGRSLDLLPSVGLTVPPQSVRLAIGLLVAIVVCAAAMWYVGRADRRAMAAARAARQELPLQVALDELDDATPRTS